VGSSVAIHSTACCLCLFISIRVILCSEHSLILAKKIQRFLVYGVVYKMLGTHLAKEIQREYSGDPFARQTTLYNNAT
jgi:hypothetical protein